MEQFKNFFIIGTLLCVISFSHPALAEEPQQVKTLAKFHVLNIDEATALAIKNNFSIQMAKYDASIAQSDKGEAESIYDTILNAQVNYQKDERAVTSTILGTEETTNNYNISLTKKVPSGTTIGVGMENQRKANNSSFSTSPVTHESILGISVSQELGRNFFGLQDRGTIKLTLMDIKNAEYISLDTIQKEIAEVQKTYWDLVLAQELVLIEEEMVGQAKRLYDLHQEKLEDGLVELPEAIASEANYKERLNELDLAVNLLEQKSNALELLLNIADEKTLLSPKDKFVLADGEEIFPASLKEALNNRFDYKELLSKVESRKLEVSMKKNELWPEINLTASLQNNGLGDHFKQSAKRLTKENNPNFFAGLTVEFPLENTRARSRLNRSQLKDAKALLNLKFLERKIAISIQDRVRSANTLQSVAHQSLEVAALHERKLLEEEKRFQYGRSDTDTIIRFQEDLIQSKRKAAIAQCNYLKELVDLSQEKGSLLAKYGEVNL